MPGALYVYTDPRLRRYSRRSRRWRPAAPNSVSSLPAAALAYSLTEPLVDVTIVGVTNAQELEWDLAALDVTLSRAELESIAEAGAIDPALLGGPTFIRSWPGGPDSASRRRADDRLLRASWRREAPNE